MNGYKLTFYTQQGRSHGHMSIAEWLLKEAKAIGVEGATFAAAQGGYGRDGKYHSARFFDVGEQPMEVTMAVSPEHSEQLFARIEQENLQIFYMWNLASPAREKISPPDRRQNRPPNKEPPAETASQTTSAGGSQHRQTKN